LTVEKLALKISGLLKLKEQRDAIRESMKGQQTNMADREQMREAHFSAFKGQLDIITDAHPDLKAQYTKEMTKMKEQWVKDIEAMRPANNRGMGNGPQNILDKMTDPAFILMWNPQMNYGKMMMQHHRMNQRNGMGRPGMRGSQGMNGMKGANCNQMDRGPKVDQPGIHIFPQPAEATTVIKISGVMNQEVQADVYNAKGKKTVKDMINLANMVRTGFINGDISTTISPRTVICWAENATILGDIDLGFKVSFLNRCDEAERPIIAEYYQRCFNKDILEVA